MVARNAHSVAVSLGFPYTDTNVSGVYNNILFNRFRKNAERTGPCVYVGFNDPAQRWEYYYDELPQAVKPPLFQYVVTYHNRTGAPFSEHESPLYDQRQSPKDIWHDALDLAAKLERDVHTIEERTITRLDLPRPVDAF